MGFASLCGVALGAVVCARVGAAFGAAAGAALGCALGAGLAAGCCARSKQGISSATQKNPPAHFSKAAFIEEKPPGFHFRARNPLRRARTALCDSAAVLSTSRARGAFQILKSSQRFGRFLLISASLSVSPRLCVILFRPFSLLVGARSARCDNLTHCGKRIFVSRHTRCVPSRNGARHSRS
jgi:hypothetical protein